LVQLSFPQSGFDFGGDIYHRQVKLYARILSAGQTGVSRCAVRRAMSQ